MIRGINEGPKCGNDGASGGLVLAVTERTTLFYGINSDGVVDYNQIWNISERREKEVICCRYCESRFDFEEIETSEDGRLLTKLYLLPV
jgi:hypothetical protein